MLRNARDRVDVNGLFAPTLLNASAPGAAAHGDAPQQSVGSGLTVAQMLYGDEAQDETFAFAGGASSPQRSPGSSLINSRRGNKMVDLFRKHGKGERASPSRRIVKARGSARSPNVFNTSPDKVRRVPACPSVSFASSPASSTACHANSPHPSLASCLAHQPQRRRAEVQRTMDHEVDRSRRHAQQRESKQQQEDLVASLANQQTLSSS